uniref:hypothetical protein n=1 Tax=Limnohabitans sp. TaxID=1907725 RepID=UPI004047606F
MSFQIKFSYASDGVVVKIPTSELPDAPTIDDAPFSLWIQDDGTTPYIYADPFPANWSMTTVGSDTVFSRNMTGLSGSTVELMPLDISDPSYLSFPPSGYIGISSAELSVSVTVEDSVAPTLAGSGIKNVDFAADGTTALGAKEVAYTVTFSERVHVPVMQTGSLFGGVPSGATFTLTPMVGSTAAAAGTLSDVWHVKVTTLNDNEAVNLTLRPQLQPVSSEDLGAIKPTGDDVTFVGGDIGATHWMKVTLDGDLYPGDFANIPLPQIAYSGPMQPYTSAGAAVVAVGTSSSTTSTNVLYLGLSSAPAAPPYGSELTLVSVPSGETQVSPLGGVIWDEAGNLFDAASMATVVPFFGPVVTVVNDGNMDSFVSAGTVSGIEILDLSPLSTGPLLVDAEYGFMTVYDAKGQARTLDIAGYDKYVLNDRYMVGDQYVYGNTFYGTADSEYVVVGDGGGNRLFAGNQFSGSTEAETDIVDYSQITIDATLQGIELDLGNSASKAVEVSYLGGGG